MVEKFVLALGQNSVWQFAYRIGVVKIAAVNRVSEVHRFPSGKGLNVARALKRLGVPVIAMGYCGGQGGRRFEDGVAGEEIPSRWIQITGETRTCVTLLEADGPATELVEPSPSITAAERDAFHAAFAQLLPQSAFLVISGTAMSGERDDCYREFIGQARQAGVPTLLDSYRRHAEIALESQPEIVKLNEYELGELSGVATDTITQRQTASKRLCERFGVRWVITTRGAAGIEGFDGQQQWAVAAPTVPVINPVGSGDSATAGVVAQLMQAGGSPGAHIASGGRIFKECLRRATAMGTANCLHIQTAAIVPSEVDDLLRQVAAQSLPAGAA